MVQDKSSPSRPVSTNDTTSLKFSNAVWNVITKCWAENVFLNVLADRFLILSMQIFGRYLDWLCEIASSSMKDTATTKLLVRGISLFSFTYSDTHSYQHNSRSHPCHFVILPLECYEMYSNTQVHALHDCKILSHRVSRFSSLRF